MNDKTKTLAITSIYSIITVGFTTFLIWLTKIIDIGHSYLIILSTLLLAMYLMLEAYGVISRLYLLSMLKRYLLGYENSLEGVLNLPTHHILIIGILLYPWMFIFSFYIIDTDLNSFHYIILFIVLFIQSWTRKLTDYRYTKIYLEFLKPTR